MSIHFQGLLRAVEATAATTAWTVGRRSIRRGLARGVATGSTTGQAPSKRQAPTTQLCWLDLRGAGLSILERLVLEEFLWKHDDRHWVICGSHTPRPHRFLRVKQQKQQPQTQQQQTTTRSNAAAATSSWDVDDTHPNDSVAIILGIGGKPELLLNLNAVRADQVPTLRRFSGGGTVVLDHNSLWTTMIGRRTRDNRNDNNELKIASSTSIPEIGPRSILKYTADTIHGPMFTRLSKLQAAATQQQNVEAGQQSLKPLRTMVLDTKSCGVENSGRLLSIAPPRAQKDATRTQQITTTAPSEADATSASGTTTSAFALLENDFVWGNRKIGGNAQSIGQSGWLQHTSLVWDYEAENMAYLTLPTKRPDYRNSRPHSDFLVKLKDIFPSLTQAHVVQALAATCRETFNVQAVTVADVMTLWNSHGGMQAWFETKCRTKILTGTV